MCLGRLVQGRPSSPFSISLRPALSSPTRILGVRAGAPELLWSRAAPERFPPPLSSGGPGLRSRGPGGHLGLRFSVSPNQDEETFLFSQHRVPSRSSASCLPAGSAANHCSQACQPPRAVRERNAQELWPARLPAASRAPGPRDSGLPRPQAPPDRIRVTPSFHYISGAFRQLRSQSGSAPARSHLWHHGRRLHTGGEQSLGSREPRARAQRRKCFPPHRQRGCENSASKPVARAAQSKRSRKEQRGGRNLKFNS